MFTYWLGSRIPIPPKKPASRKAGGGGRRDGSKPLGRIVGFPESDPLPERGPILRYRLEVVLATLAPRIRHGDGIENVFPEAGAVGHFPGRAFTRTWELWNCSRRRRTSAQTARRGTSGGVRGYTSTSSALIGHVVDPFQVGSLGYRAEPSTSVGIR